MKPWEITKDNPGEMNTVPCGAKRSIYACTALVFFVLATPSMSHAANHYIWCGATGAKTGVDFANAFTDLPASGTLVRGDTYYVAGDATCTYAPYTFNDAESGTLVIKVIKVTSSQSGVAGFAYVMATNSAKWLIATQPDPETDLNPEWSFCDGFYTIDGVTGSTDPIAGPGGQGFVLQSSGSMSHGHIYISSYTCGGDAKTFSNITLRHIEIKTDRADAYNPVPVTSCSYAGGTATITTNTPGWSQAWLVGDYVSGSTKNHLVAFGPSGSAVQIASVNGNTITVPLASSPCSNLAFAELDTGPKNSVGGRGMYISSTANTYNNLDVQYCYFHPSGFDDVVYFSGSGSIFAHNYFTGNIGWPQAHGQPFQVGALTNTAIAFNVFVDPLGTGIVFNNSSTGLDNTSINLSFYSNLIIGTGDDVQNSGLSSLVEAKDVTCTQPGSAPIDGLVAYGNTISGTSAANGAWAGNVGFIDGAGACSRNWVIENNLWYDSIRASLISAAITHDYNTLLNTTAVWNGAGPHDFQTGSGSKNPFANRALNNFNLSSETVDPHLNDGIPLPAPFNADFAGNTRGADGTWERGIYEFSGTPPKPNPPPNLRVTDSPSMGWDLF